MKKRTWKKGIPGKIVAAVAAVIAAVIGSLNTQVSLSFTYFCPTNIILKTNTYRKE